MASSESAAITAVELTSSVQLLPPATNSGSVSMPWMVPSYPMMVLQQGIPQSLFAPNVLALPDGHIMLAPVDESAAAGHQLLADVGSTVVQLVKSPKPQGQWPTGAGAAAKGNSVRGAPEAGGNTKQDLGSGAGAMKPVKNGSIPVLASQSGPQPLATAKTDLPAQPKRPLTPYMLFSKSIWSHVKAANSHLSSVCEIGAIVGSLWRDMDPKEKQRYNDLFAKDKERYENELQTYLRNTGLHASDLAKLPKPKRNRDKPPSTTSWASFGPSSAPQGTQTMAGGAVGPNCQAPADILPTFSQAWTGQVTPQQQQTAQQVLTQLGLGGQTLYANSDGSISIGGSNVSNLLSLPTQSLQLVSVTGEPVMTIYSDKGQTGVSQIGVVNASNETSAGLDGSRSSWVWQQQQQPSAATGQDGMDGSGGGMVLYQLPNSVDSLGKVIELKSQLDEPNPAGSSSMRPLIPSMDQQFSVEQLSQLVGGAGTILTREAKLEAELQQMGCALKEKAQEVLVLKDKLQQAYEVIERYKQLSGESAMEDSKDDAAADSAQDDGNCLGEIVDVPSQSSAAEN